MHTEPKFPATCLPDIFPVRAQHPVTRIPLRRPSSPIAGPPGAVFPRLAALICCQIRAIFQELHCWFPRDAVASTATDLHPSLLPVAWLHRFAFPGLPGRLHFAGPPPGSRSDPRPKPWATPRLQLRPPIGLRFSSHSRRPFSGEDSQSGLASELALRPTLTPARLREIGRAHV